MLAWLYLRASKIYEWFGGSYNLWSNRLKNFWDHLTRYAEKAFRWSKDWALPKIISYWQNAKDRIGDALNSAYHWTVTKSNQISVFLSEKIQAVKDLAGMNYQIFSTEDIRTNNKITAIKERLSGINKTWIEKLIDNFFNPFRWITDFQDFLIELKELFTEENKSRFIYLLGDGFGFLINWITKPLQMLLALIEPIFLEFATYLLAYALAGEKYELPDFPSFYHGSSGGKLKGFDPPEDAKRGLGKPLNKLYISGYRFRVGHRGLDLGLKNGDPVFAMHSGIIEYVNQTYSGYGFQVIVSGGPWWTRSAHLQMLGVKKGDTVSKGEVIGLGDDTGNSTGPHLHLEIKYNGKFVDPEIILF